MLLYKQDYELAVEQERKYRKENVNLKLSIEEYLRATSK
jgi:hypothetical protein